MPKACLTAGQKIERSFEVLQAKDTPPNSRHTELSTYKTPRPAWRIARDRLLWQDAEGHRKTERSETVWTIFIYFM